MSDRFLELHCEDPIATEELGRALGALVEPGDFVALDGELGAGKTTLVRGLAGALGIADPVSSPTYLLCHEYSGEVPLLHLDAYFSARMDGLLAEGLVERFATAVVVVEWAAQLGDWLPAERLGLEMAEDPRGGRRIRIRAWGTRAAALLAGLRTAYPSLSAPPRDPDRSRGSGKA